MVNLLYFSIFRKIVVDSRSRSLNVGVVGKTQTGKSTYVKKFSDEFLRVKNLLYPKQWKETEWDHEKYCAKNFAHFVELVDTNDFAVIVIEEAGFSLGNMDYNTVISQIFGKIIMTQAYKRNLYIICLPHLLQFVKQHRFILDFMFVMRGKNEAKKEAFIMPQMIRRDYWKIKDDSARQIFYPPMRFRYTKDELKRSKEFIEYLKLFKKDILKDLRLELSGYNPRKRMSRRNFPNYYKDLID